MLMQMALNDWSNLENTDLEIRWKGTGKMIQDIEHWDLPWPYISQSERLASLLTLQLVASSISDQSNVCAQLCKTPFFHADVSWLINLKSNFHRIKMNAFDS